MIQEERVVQNDNTVTYNGLILQIPKNDLRHHYVKITVMVHIYEDRILAIFYGHLCLGEYNEHGDLKKEQKKLTFKNMEQKIHLHQPKSRNK